MNLTSMKKVDRYLGAPLCRLLEAVQFLLRPFPYRRFREPKRILVMKFFGMGSILLASPVLRAIKRTYPGIKIGFLTFNGNIDLIKRLGLVDEIYGLRTDSFRRFTEDLAAQLWRIRREGYDATLDMEFFAKFSAIVNYLSGSPKRVGFYHQLIWRGDLQTDNVNYNHYRHITEVFSSLAVPLGVATEDFALSRPAIRPEEHASTREILRSHGINDGEILIGFNVNASDMSLERRWPKEEFRKLAGILGRELDARLIFIGAPSDAAYVKDVAAGVNVPVIDLSGRLSIGEFLALMEKTAVFITNDSGPLHIAAALDVPTVSFFGPEIPALYGPKGGDALVFYERFYCSPCLNIFNVKTAPCHGRNICMQKTRAEDVALAMKQRYPHLWENYGKATARATA